MAVVERVSLIDALGEEFDPKRRVAAADRHADALLGTGRKGRRGPVPCTPEDVGRVMLFDPRRPDPLALARGFESLGGQPVMTICRVQGSWANRFGILQPEGTVHYGVEARRNRVSGQENFGASARVGALVTGAALYFDEGIVVEQPSDKDKAPVEARLVLAGFSRTRGSDERRDDFVPTNTLGAGLAVGDEAIRERLVLHSAYGEYERNVAAANAYLGALRDALSAKPIQIA